MGLTHYRVAVDRARISHLAHADHRVAAPLGDETVDRLLDRALEGRRHVLDLGCGDGTWLLRAVRRHPDLRATGVDLSGAGFDRVLEEADATGVGDRLALHRGDAREFTPEQDVDAVLCVGATHAFGGLVGTLRAARALLSEDGVLLLGDGFWERPPTAAALAGLGAEEADLADLAGTVAAVTSHGWSPVYGHVSTLREWDDYEWSWTGSLTQWALDHPGDADVAQVRSVAEQHRQGWLEGYRGVLGFVTLVLRPDPR